MRLKKSMTERTHTSRLREKIGAGILAGSLIFVRGSTIAHAVEQTPTCEYQFGFSDLAQKVGKATVGSCLDNQAENPESHTVEQHTTRGLLVYDKNTNRSMFTNGETTKLLRANGTVAERFNTDPPFQWESMTSEEEKAAIIAATAPKNVREIVKEQTIVVFGESQWPAMEQLIFEESGWDPNAQNARSGACGLFQANPCSKMGGMDIDHQLGFGIPYILDRYKTPSNALAAKHRNGGY